MTEAETVEAPVTDSAPEPETVTPPDTVVEDSEAEPVAVEPAAVPDPAEQRRSRALAIAARERTKALRSLEEAKATRAEADRIMAEARKIQERGERLTRIFESDDPISAMREAGIDPEKTIYGLNDKVLSQGTPEAKLAAYERKLAALEAKTAEREAELIRAREEQAQARAVSQFSAEFAATVESGKEKYPAVAKLRPEVRERRMWELANAYYVKTREQPTHEMLADGLEYLIRTEYDEYRGLFSSPDTPSSAAGDGRRDTAPGTPKLTSKLAGTIATPPRVKSEDEEREEWAAEIRAARANGAR